MGIYRFGQMFKAARLLQLLNNIFHIKTKEMSTSIQKYKAPKLADLINDKEMAFAQDDLNLILNTPVPQDWVKFHPTVKIKINGEETPLPFIPVKRVKWLLKRIYGKYQWEVKECKQVLNAMVVIGKLTIKNPVTGEYESQDGVGAASIQMNKGATQGDLSAIKSNAIQIGAPAAESYALKNAAEKFGDIFGGNIYDIDSTAYSPVFPDEVRNPATIEDITELFELKRESMTDDQVNDAERIIEGREVANYQKLFSLLKSI